MFDGVRMARKVEFVINDLKLKRSYFLRWHDPAQSICIEVRLSVRRVHPKHSHYDGSQHFDGVCDRNPLFEKAAVEDSQVL